MTTTTTTRAGAREWGGLAVLTIPLLLASLEITLPNLALPAISRDLEPSATQTLWVVDVYGFVLAGLLITMGSLGDRIGRRRLLLSGMAGFAVFSLVAAYAPTTEVLIAARALLGVAGATLMPSALALVATLFRDPRQRGTAIGLVVASVAGGTAIGPLVGGWVLEHLWWGAVFLVAVPIAALFLVVAPLLLPETTEDGGAPIDPPSVALALVAVLSSVYALKTFAAHGPAPSALAGLVLSVPAAWAFLSRQRRLARPMVDLRLLVGRAFSVSLVVLLLGIFVLFGLNFFLAQHLQLVLGMSPLQAGLWTAPSAVGVIGGSTLAPVLARRLSAGGVVAGGLLVGAAGLVALTSVVAPGVLLPVVAATVVVSLGLGAMMSLSTDLAVGAAPPERAGSASALAETAPELGGALGVAVLGSIGAAVYRASVEGTPGVSSGEAGQTLGGAADVAASMPGAAGRELLAVAQEGFVDGFQVVAAVGAAVLVVVAVLVAAVLREAGSPSR